MAAVTHSNKHSGSIHRLSCGLEPAVNDMSCFAPSRRTQPDPSRSHHDLLEEMALTIILTEPTERAVRVEGPSEERTEPPIPPRAPTRERRVVGSSAFLQPLKVIIIINQGL